jgi:hypothetical protein
MPVDGLERSLVRRARAAEATQTLGGDLVVGHLLDIVEERLRGLEERLEVRALPEAVQMSFGRVPLDADDLLIGLVNTAGRLPAPTLRRGIEQRPARR